MWSERLEKITSVSEQLCSHVAFNIMMNLEDAHSTYAQSFHLVKREIAKVSTNVGLIAGHKCFSGMPVMRKEWKEHYVV